MKEELRYNWLDVFRAPRIALSLQKVWIMFLPILIGYLFYLCFTFLGFMVSGELEPGMTVQKAAWGRQGLLPCAASMPGVNVAGYLLWLVGVVFLAGSILLAATAVARATFLELKGETFFTYRELYGFARKHAKSVLLGPMGLLAVIGGIVLCGVIVGLIGRIWPPVGVIPVVGLSPIWLGISFFLVALIFVFVFCVLLAPAITATSKGDFFEVITETFSLTFSEPYRLAWYQVVLCSVALVAVSILGLIVKLAYVLMSGILAAGMGREAFGPVAAKATNLLASWFPALLGKDLSFGAAAALQLGYAPQVVITTGGLGGALGQAPAVAEATGYFGFWGCILAIVCAVAGFLVIACYGTALVAAGNTITYIVLHKIKDEENLLELEEEEEEEGEEEGKPADPSTAPSLPPEAAAPAALTPLPAEAAPEGTAPPDQSAEAPPPPPPPEPPLDATGESAATKEGEAGEDKGSRKPHSKGKKRSKRDDDDDDDESDEDLE